MKTTNYEKMTKEQLKKELSNKGIDFQDSMKKPQLVELLNGKVEQSAEETKKPEKCFTYAMRSAIIEAHKSGNKHAITLNDTKELGIKKSEYDYWLLQIQKYYEAVQKHADLARTKDADPKELASSYNALFTEWKKLLLVGEENKFHKNLWISEYDVNFHIGKISKHVLTSKCKIDGNVTVDTFRKFIETQIGVKIANNGVMTNSDRDIIESYYASVNSKKSAERRLYGYDLKNQHINGVIDNIEIAEKKIKNDKAQLANIGVTDERAETFLKSSIEALKQLKNTKNQLNKNITTAEENIIKLEDKVKAIEDKLEVAKLD